MQKFSFKMCLGALILAIAITGCGKKEAPPQSMTLPVTLLDIKKENAPITFEFVGQTAGYREVEVRAKVSGTLLKRNYQEGDRVGAGQSLFLIDPEPYRAVADQARASLAVSQAALTQANADFAKIAPLYKTQAISKKEYDDAQAAVMAAKANVQAGQAALRQAQINLGYTNVTAPVEGVTSKGVFSEGSFISATTLLTTVSQLDPLYANFTLSQSEADLIRGMMDANLLTVGEASAPAGMNQSTSGSDGLGKFQVRLKLSDGTISDAVGEVDFTDSVVDPATGSIKARAIFSNANNQIAPGQFVRVILAGGGRPNGIVIPQKAIMTNQQGKLVWVQGKDDVVEMRVLTLGQEVSGNRVIVEKGLMPGDKLVTDNLMKIRPGTKVKHEPSEAQAQAKQQPGADKKPAQKK